MVIFVGMALKLEIGDPTFWVSIHVHPTLGTRVFFPRVRVDASVSVAGRQLTETGNRAWKVCGTQGMSILTIRSKRRQETVSIPKSSLK